MMNHSNDRLIDQANDTYCHSLARIDKLGENRRLVFTVPGLEGEGWENVVAKLILPADFMVALAYMLAGADQKTVSPALIALETHTAN